MKIKLVCPICGMEDWKKSDEGLFKCSFCGTSATVGDMIPKVKDTFADTEWSNEDIEVALESLEMEVTEQKVKYWRDVLDSDENIERIIEQMCIAGSEEIVEIIRDTDKWDYE